MFELILLILGIVSGILLLLVAIVGAMVIPEKGCQDE